MQSDISISSPGASATTACTEGLSIILEIYYLKLRVDISHPLLDTFSQISSLVKSGCKAVSARTLSTGLTGLTPPINIVVVVPTASHGADTSVTVHICSSSTARSYIIIDNLIKENKYQ